MQFPLETVREVAQILTDSGLGEISLESTGEGPVRRLAIRRPVALVAAPIVDEELTDEETAAVGEETAAAPAGPELISITSTAVGVFRPGKPQVAVGDEVKRKQLIAVVESLKIPFEIYAPEKARVVEVLATDGQGVEWGQTLLVLEPLA